MDDLHFQEVGPAYPASEEYLNEDFESEEVRNWVLTQTGGDWHLTEPGAGDGLNPRISEEKAHSGKRSLKLSRTLGIIARPFAGNVTHCVVTAWFCEEPSDRCRMVILVDERGRRIGLGTHRESVTNYSCLLGGKPQPTEIEKSAQWHEFRFVVVDGRGVACYIDGVKVGETERFDSFRVLQLGENFLRGSTCYMDDISIQLKAQQ